MIDSSGKTLGTTLRFSKTQAGGKNYFSGYAKVRSGSVFRYCCIEATGHITGWLFTLS
jgi:hypothetical protein